MDIEEQSCGETKEKQGSLESDSVSMHAGNVFLSKEHCRWSYRHHHINLDEGQILGPIERCVGIIEMIARVLGTSRCEENIFNSSYLQLLWLAKKHSQRSTGRRKYVCTIPTLLEA